jgi:hypothetical protein
VSQGSSGSEDRGEGGRMRAGVTVPVIVVGVLLIMIAVLL